MPRLLCRVRSVVIAAALLFPVASSVAPPAAHADSGSCTSGQMCLASGTTAGLGCLYQFLVDDSNLSNNTYTTCGGVDDNNRAIRDRKSGTTRACAYVDDDYQSGATGYANYSGATWVNLNSSDGSSIRFRFSASC